MVHFKSSFIYDPKVGAMFSEHHESYKGITVGTFVRQIYYWSKGVGIVTDLIDERFLEVLWFKSSEIERVSRYELYDVNITEESVHD